MKNTAISSDLLRALLRWSTAVATTATLIAGSCLLVPAIVGSPAALALTCAIAAILGLMIGLPPVDEADDWAHALIPGQAVEAVQESVETARPVPVKPGPMAQVRIIRAAQPRPHRNRRPHWKSIHKHNSQA